MYEIPQLEYFRTVARLQNITQAAEELHVAQPNLSNSIQKLENTLGVKLFDRTRGRIYLNTYGKIYLNAVNQALECLERGEQEINNELARNARGHITIASSMQIFSDDLIDRYYENNSESRLFINQDLANLDDIPVRFKKETLDLAIVPDCALPQNTISEKLYDFEVCVLLAQDHPLANKKTIRLTDLQDSQFICNNLGVNHMMTLDLCTAAGFSPNVVFETNDFKSVGRWVEQGRGISLIPSYDMLSLIDQQMPVACLRIVDPCIMVNVNLVKRAGRGFSSDELSFIDYLTEYFQALGRASRDRWERYCEN